ncbi:MAG TPA: RES family NAD+ phosphorylase [Acetobacteraceae bacterium]|nr:RES family NAD+ phosphorylase [Acetobacteraceae bacterium]
MWTPPALASEARAWSGKLWRIVESQFLVSTLKLVDSLDEQAILEAELERSKPLVPTACAGLHYLLATPFRYAPYPRGTRFRRARQPEGCFYAAEHVETAVAEEAFYRLLFFLDSPHARLPSNPQERTAFRVPAQTARAIDLTAPPLARDAALWTHPVDYAPCQALADAARAAGIDAIRYRSVRDPKGGANVALLSPAAFRTTKPDKFETWHLFLRESAAQAVREMPRLTIEIPFSVWAADPRVPARLS